MKSYHFSVVAVLFLSAISQGLSAGFVDDFSKPNLDIRQALRGDWKYEEGVASCYSDPVAYKEFKNHGPILRWPAVFTDGVVECEFRPRGCERLVITLNEDGHVFRISLNTPERTRIFGWIGKSSKENKAKDIAKEGVPPIASLEGKWTQLRLEFNGEKAKVQIGAYRATLEHPSIGRKKGEFTMSFALGECDFRNVKVVTAE